MRNAIVGLFVAVLAGCSFAPKYERPPSELPESWRPPGGRPLQCDCSPIIALADATYLTVEASASDASRAG